MHKKKSAGSAGVRAVNRSQTARARKAAGNSQTGRTSKIASGGQLARTSKVASGGQVARTGKISGAGRSSRMANDSSYQVSRRTGAPPGYKKAGASYGYKKKTYKGSGAGRQGNHNRTGNSLKLLDNAPRRSYQEKTYLERKFGDRPTPGYVDTERPKKPKKPKKPKISLYDMLRLHKSILILVMTIAVIALLGVGVIEYIRSHYRVQTVNVSGNTYYSDEQIQDMVMNGMFSHNSLFLGFKYHDKSITDIPFIEKITIDIKSADTIDIHVYEKALAGCISYLESYMYFDREGIIVESSSQLLEGVPVVRGLKYDSVVILKPLPVEDNEVFAEILDLTQLLSKYNLQADQMYFDSVYNVYLYFDNIEVAMGSKKNIDEKVIQLPYILPSLEGKKGTLHLEDYDENTDSVRFEEAT